MLNIDMSEYIAEFVHEAVFEHLTDLIWHHQITNQDARFVEIMDFLEALDDRINRIK